MGRTGIGVDEKKCFHVVRKSDDVLEENLTRRNGRKYILGEVM